MTISLEELRQLVRAKPAHVASISRSLKREARHKAKAGACWAYVAQCEELRGKVATCHDSGDPRCAG